VKQAFINNMNLGTAGSDLPRGLEAMSTALSPAMLSGANSGFLRSGALLAVLFLADQDDISGGNITDYVDFLSSVKPPFPYGYKGWVASSFVVQSLSAECRTFNSFASVGMRFLDLTNQSSGVSESICSGDLTQATASLQSRIASMLTQFTLGRAADPQSIKVFINGVQIPQDPGNGWTYVPTGYLIVFHGASIPPANAQISVKFNPTTIGH
jgi:hypothetical protein